MFWGDRVAYREEVSGQRSARGHGIAVAFASSEAGEGFCTIRTELTMRFLNLQNTMLISLLVAGVGAAGCSSGSDAPNTTGGAGGSSTGASGSTGTAGQTSGTAGMSMAGAGGSSTGTA